MTASTFLFHLAYAAAIAGLAALLTRVLIARIGALDIPNERSSHSTPTPRGGGIAFILSFVVGLSLIQFLGTTVPIQERYFWGVTVGSALIIVISLRDDFKMQSLRTKTFVQLLAIAIVCVSGLAIDKLGLPWLGEYELGSWGYLLTVAWIFGMMNTVNFMDGLDGLVATSAVIASLFLSFISFMEGSVFVYAAALTLAAAISGFLLFNLPPARIFMGDVGSIFIGFTLASIAIIAARYDHAHTSLFVVPLLLFHLILDAFMTFCWRLVRGENVFSGHRTHIYQLLNRMGLSHRAVTSFYASLSVLQGVAAWYMVKFLSDVRILMFIPFLIIYTSIGIAVHVRARRVGLY